MKTIEQPHELRYERKFLITDHTHQQVEQLLKFHPAAFSSIFYPRMVNNIYFDTLGFEGYYDNVEGERDRMKVRIRWYGNLAGNITAPVLEFKIKNGLLGNKESYNLQPFTMDAGFDREQIVRALSGNNIPQHVRNHVLSLRPVLMNRYARSYYLSADGRFRITIDHDLTYYRMAYGKGFLPTGTVDHTSVVLELKYDAAMGEEAMRVGDSLPFAMTKNSKYLQGMERIVF